MSDKISVPCGPTEFFGFSIPRVLAAQVIGARCTSKGLEAVILAISPKWKRVTNADVSGRTSIVSFPASVGALFKVLLGQQDDRADRDRVDVLIPKSVLNELADRAGADQITELRLGAGAAASDPILKALQECFEGLRALASFESEALSERVVEALNTHLAERYGGMRKPVGVSRGGLAPWQLRLARRSLNQLESSTPLTEIARNCGLSSGHFARAFKRSTGNSPHQWGVQRRIEAAKEMLRFGTPLAEIAIACRFSDQSHLTRAFAQATGTTPGRWRVERALALSR